MFPYNLARRDFVVIDLPDHPWILLFKRTVEDARPYAFDHNRVHRVNSQLRVVAWYVLCEKSGIKI